MIDVDSTFGNLIVHAGGITLIRTIGKGFLIIGG